MYGSGIIIMKYFYRDLFTEISTKRFKLRGQKNNAENNQFTVGLHCQLSNAHKIITENRSQRIFKHNRRTKKTKETRKILHLTNKREKALAVRVDENDKD